jgi:hypothetical protein
MDLGDVFRVDFADDAVAAITFRGIETGIRALDERVSIVVGLEY